MFDRVIRLRRDMDEIRVAIERLLDEHHQLIDRDMAGVIASYMRSLQLDFELAVSRGREGDLSGILEDVSELHSATLERVDRSRRGTRAFAPLQS